MLISKSRYQAKPSGGGCSVQFSSSIGSSSKQKIDSQMTNNFTMQCNATRIPQNHTYWCTFSIMSVPKSRSKLILDITISHANFRTKLYDNILRPTS